jgi:hypothetical protein
MKQFQRGYEQVKLVHDVPVPPTWTFVARRNWSDLDILDFPRGLADVSELTGTSFHVTELIDTHRRVDVDHKAAVVHQHGVHFK